jgi:hypothetical protein
LSILAVIGLVVSLAGLILGSFVNVIPLTLYALILIYLFTYNVRAFFGRAPPYAAIPAPPPFPPTVMPPPVPQPVPSAYYGPPPPQTPPPQPAYYPPPPQPTRRGFMSQRTTMCPNCLSPIPLGAASCPRCGAPIR